ncbi:MAG: glycosyltransferase [Nitrospirae bacterium]|nr:glycosyltransferase [Nitrospirota bacterium]MCL5976735.1 glycosyltransferase [Nitrospirota bacterium]
MNENKKPLVSVGMPLYNAAKMLRMSKAIESLLNQNYENIEIIISDNGSTDETEAICKEFAAQDKRIKYFRNDVNLGIVYNFNRVFELSQGKYFMWAAHDDTRSPQFISKCVEKLEANPDAVLCQAYTQVTIEGNNSIMYIATFNDLENKQDILDRYSLAIRILPATALYGIMRSEAMKKTLLWQKHAAADVAFLFELLLYGKFIQVSEVLFTYYGREKWSTMEQEYHAFHPERKMPKIYWPFIILMIEQIKRIIRSPLSLKIKTSLTALTVAINVKTVTLKIICRLTTFLNNEKCPEVILKYIVKEYLDNKNIRILDEYLYDSRVRQIQLKNWTG